MAWYLAPALETGRTEVNRRWPTRDKTSDGTIGDTAHQATRSDHNPNSRESVDAWDMDKDGVDVWVVINAFQAHPSSHYWIYNKQIADKDDGWKRRAYSGPNPHTQHVHFSIRQTAVAEQNRQPWGIWPLPQEDDLLPDQARQLAELHAALVGTKHEWAEGRNTSRLMTDLGYALLYGLPGTETTWLGKALTKIGAELNLDPEELVKIRGAIAAELAPVATGLKTEIDEVAQETVDLMVEQSSSEAARAIIAAVGPARAGEIMTAIGQELGASPAPTQ